MNLHLLTAHDIIPGSPLPWPVYDADGHLMFERGMTLAAGYPLETLYRSADDMLYKAKRTGRNKVCW